MGGTVMRLAKASTFLLLLLLGQNGIVHASDVAGASVEQSNLSQAMRARADFGLDNDPDLVQALLASKNTGWDLYQVPMTDGEFASVDIGARVRYANDVSETLAPFARSLPTFAGIFVDQHDNGRVTVLLTETDAATVDKIKALDPDPDRGLAIRLASYSFAELSTRRSNARSTGHSLPSMGRCRVRHALPGPAHHERYVVPVLRPLGPIILSVLA
jgi:hypothetical protein